ncbi:MAG: hypothetical protein MZV70_35645 [Desulfobacterales bacterium]|nr:hypothetical protein [Desulfobacterales bacterium]
MIEPEIAFAELDGRHGPRRGLPEAPLRWALDELRRGHGLLRQARPARPRRDARGGRRQSRSPA